MELYFSPMTASLASRIALYEADVPATFLQVDLATKRLGDGRDYLAVNPKGQVPALRTAEGKLLTESTVILQYVADQRPASGLAPPPGDPRRYRLQEWLGYVGAEIHKAVYYFVFHPQSPPEAKTFVREELLPARYDYLSAQLGERAFLLDELSIADAYLFTTLCWAETGGVELSRWPVLAAYRARLLGRPAVARAVSEERALRKAVGRHDHPGQ